MDPSGTVDGWHCTSPTGGKITLTIPNEDNQREHKVIFMQLTSSRTPSGVSVSGTGSASGYGVTTWPPGTVPPHQQWPGPAPFGGTWYTYFFGFIIEPNPESEEITIEVIECTVIDQIVVDTMCSSGPVPL